MEIFFASQTTRAIERSNCKDTNMFVFAMQSLKGKEQEANHVASELYYGKADLIPNSSLF